MDMPENLTDAEQRLIEAVAEGIIISFTTNDKEIEKSANGANWGPERTIRASIIRILCLGGGKDPPVDLNGIQVIGARIKGKLDLKFANIPFPLIFKSCHFEVNIILLGAEIRTLALNGSYLTNGLIADGLTVKGAVHLREDFTSKGEVRLIGATIGGYLDCSGGCFKNPDGDALTVDGSTIKGSVLLRDSFFAKGGVRMIGADIGGVLDCSNGQFIKRGTDGIALNADNLRVKGSVFLQDGFSAFGEVHMMGAIICGQLNCINGKFNNTDGHAFSLENANITATVFLSDFRINGTLNLSHAIIGQLVDEKDSWPNQDKLVLDGFKYDSFAGESPVDAKTRLKWLSLQPTKNNRYGFRPQPYEQLVKVLRAMGHERDARKIAIAKQKEMRKTLGPWARAGSWILRISTGYGYETWRAFIGMVIMVLIGTGVFWFAGNGDMQSTTDGAHIPTFNAFIYSLDAFLPIVDLHQESYWLPHSEFYKWYLWFHISVGWILTTIAVAAFTGLFKDE